MNILSAVLSLVAVILDAILLFVVKDLDLYGDRIILRPIAVQVRPIHRPAIETNIDGKVQIILLTFLTLIRIFQYFRHFASG